MPLRVAPEYGKARFPGRYDPALVLVTSSLSLTKENDYDDLTIDEQNSITAFATQEGAAAATPFDTFSSQKELAELAEAWPTERLVAVWNSLPGVAPVTKFSRQPRVAAHPGTWRDSGVSGGVCEAEGGTQGHPWLTGCQGRADQRPGLTRPPLQTRAQSQTGREDAASHRTARR